MIVQTEEQLSFQIKDSGAIPTSSLQLFVKPINKITATNCYKRWHYLKDQDFISVFNYGAYYDGQIVGAISFGPPSAIETIKGIFKETNQEGYFEIKRLAMDDICPKNSESRFIKISCMLLKKSYPKIKAIITYADSSVGHRGTIYQASNFIYMGMTSPKMDFLVNGKIQQRGKTRGISGEWIKRSRKHLFIKNYLSPTPSS